VRDASVIALLRSLDVPLATVREVLAARRGPELQAVLERERARAARDAERRLVGVSGDVPERGHEPRHPVAETYLTGPNEVPPEDYVTRLEVPISP
jgi:hypothetical protein